MALHLQVKAMTHLRNVLQSVKVLSSFTPARRTVIWTRKQFVGRIWHRASATLSQRAISTFGWLYMYVTVPSAVWKLTHTSLQLEHPEKYSLTEKPAKIKVHLNRPCSRAPVAKAAQMQGGMGPGPQILAFSGLGYPPMQPYGYLPYPCQPFPTPQQPLNPVGPLGEITTAETSELNIKYPSISEWLEYCDRHPRHSSSRLGRYANAFDNEGFVYIDQLVGPRIIIESLAGWLSIGKGTADLVIRYAEQDIQLVKAGKFQLLPSESST